MDVFAARGLKELDVLTVSLRSLPARLRLVPGASSALACLVLLIFIYAIRFVLTTGNRPSTLPHGPPVIPILGNEHQIPAYDAHFKFTEWAKQYGGIFSLKRYNNTTIVLTDRKLVKELVDKKSGIYSHRPASLVSHLITQSDHLLVMQYGDMWRKLRKMVHQYFMEPQCDREHWKLQEAEATQMLHDFLTMPEDHMLHPKRYSNSITNSLVFGIRTKTVRDDYMDRLFDIMGKWSLVLEVGSTPPVDSFAFLRMLPEWMVGRWRSRALEVGDLMQKLYLDVLDQVRARRADGINRGSFMDRVLDSQAKTPLTENQLRFLGGVLMEGGSDTSSSLILTIIQAMTKYPEVQKKAQAEIDAAVGSSRSPVWADFPKLPYINSIIKEAHRWRVVSPLGVSHALAEDDVVDGKVLPKGATVILNVWGIHHDDRRWKEPQHFNPDRFASFPLLASGYTTSDERDHYGYGSGRRICPGIHLAERNLIIGVSKLLWAFEFSEQDGIENDIDPETGGSKGFLHAPRDYGCAIRLRSPEKRETIMKEYRDVQKVFENYD